MGRMKRCLALIQVLILGAALLDITPVPISAADAEIQNASGRYEKSGKLTDTDGDGLADWIEESYGTDKKRSDTDGDGLNDYDEIIQYGTDPTLTDSDHNGICDGEEDADSDGLSNLSEMEMGTDTMQSDSDGDGLTDGDEVHKYNTNPMTEDSDKDGISDGEEQGLGLDPLKYDTDGNSVCDGNEMVRLKTAAGSEGDTVTVSATMSIQAKYKKDTTLQQLEADNPALGSNIPGYIGNTYEILSDGTVKNAVMTLTYQRKDIKNDFNPCLYYYDEASGLLIETKGQERKGNVIQAPVLSGLKYVLVNKSEYCGAWSEQAVSSETVPEPAKLMSVLSLTENGTINYNQDSNGDGISDYYTQLIYDGTIVTGLGKSYKGYDFSDPGGDYDGDGLLNGEEIKVVSDGGQIYLKMATDPVLDDTDYDGRNDKADEDSKSNSFSGNMKSSFASMPVSYTMDYREFFQPSSVYSSKISTYSSVCSALMYSGASVDGKDAEAFLKENGLTDVKYYKLGNIYSDNHISEFIVGHRKVNYNGKTKEVIGVIVRGTSGDIKEWASNFDIGSTGEFDTYSDWVVSQNHKGFDIAATRILKCVSSYVSSYTDQSADAAYWVTGHSRGAAIANVIGARLADEGKTAYTYTFAAPNTTTASNASQYTGIFNIVNSDDLVPCLPMEAWGFTRYGKTCSFGIADNYETEWEDLTQISDYNPDTYGFQDTVKALGSIMDDRDDCNTITYENTYGVSHYYTTESNRNETLAKVIASYPSNAQGTYEQTLKYDSSAWFYKYGYAIYQSPSFLMQILAAVMAGEFGGTYGLDYLTLDVASYLEEAKWAIIWSALGGIEHPHYSESYYLLSTHITAEDF